MPDNNEQLTQILASLNPDDPRSSEELLPLVYQELRRLAAARMAQEPPGQTLQATALVHEAWLRLVSSEQRSWQNRGHFFGAAAEAMRRILVENARRKRQLKRGGNWHRVDWEGLEIPELGPDDRLLAIDEALDELTKVGPVEAEVVKLHFFVGLEHAEIAALLNLSERTVHRYWAFAKVWLFQRLSQNQAGQAPQKETPLA
ncbi:MAG TPA: sigma-70 family RNA polymerase sigma factor [Clostridia bacterium]|nr:sigma-70 family RNA polymerase sigma factor [Clostridia bacterium]